MPITSSARRVSACVSLILALSVCADAQSITVAWDATPATTDPQTNPAGYIVYWGTQSGVYPNTSNVGTALQHVIQVPADGTRYYVAVAAYAEGPIIGPLSAEVSALAPMPPPPPPVETCAADGTGNGIDEDGDGMVDEGCLVPPPPPADTVAPSVTATVRQHGGSHNYTVTITASDNVAVVQIVLMQGGGVRAACSPTPPAPEATCEVQLALKPRGTYTYEAQAWDTSNNLGAAPVTIRR